MKISVKPYNPEWKNQFHLLKGEIGQILKEKQPIIEHFGSTSIVGLAAKPIIDIMVGVKDLIELDEIIKPMVAAGYIYYEVFNETMPERRLFIKLKEGHTPNSFKSIYRTTDELPHEAINEWRWAHIHVWVLDSSEWTRHIAFRDFVRLHPQVQKSYGELKLKLSQEDWEDGMEYNEAKNAFIQRIQSKALSWHKKKMR